MALFEALQEKDGFTPNEAQLAEYVIAHVDEASTLGISELAERCYTSKAAISRFCKKLGLGSYHQFQVDLASEAEKARLARGSVDVNQPFHAGESTPDIMADMATLSREAINMCYAHLSPEKVKQAARLISQARSVYLYGVGDSCISTLAFANMLIKLGIHCVNATMYNESLANTYAVGSHDVALIVSYSYSIVNKMPVELDVLRARGCKIIAITANPNPDGANLALTFPHKENAGASMATFYSQACIRYILNCVYAAIYTRDFATNEGHRRAYERLSTGK